MAYVSSPFVILSGRWKTSFVSPCCTKKFVARWAKPRGMPSRFLITCATLLSEKQRTNLDFPHPPVDKADFPILQQVSIVFCFPQLLK